MKQKTPFNYSEPANLVMLGGVVLTLISLFLPFYTIMGMYTFNYVYNSMLGQSSVADGIFVIIFMIVAIIFIFLQKPVVVLIMSVLSLLLYAYTESNMDSELGSYSDMVTRGIGPVLLVIGCLVVLGGAIMNINR